MHIDAHMLCRKFELILTNIFWVEHFKKRANFWKKAKAIAHGFFQKLALKSPPIFITFSDTYWCPYAMYKVWADSNKYFLSYEHFKKPANFWKKAKAIAHGFFQKLALKSPPIFITFSDTYWCPYAMYKVWADSNKYFLSYEHFKKPANFWKKAKAIAHGFFQKLAPKSPPILLHFLIHTDVLILCRNCLLSVLCRVCLSKSSLVHVTWHDKSRGVTWQVWGVWSRRKEGVARGKHGVFWCRTMENKCNQEPHLKIKVWRR